MNPLLRPLRRICAAPLLLCSSLALAQSTLGELLDAGGKRLGKEELTTLLVGATYGGRTTSGRAFQLAYKGDGTLTGYVAGIAVSGKWSIDEAGKDCSELSGGGLHPDRLCMVWFKSGDHYFVSDSESDRKAALRKRRLIETAR